MDKGAREAGSAITVNQRTALVNFHGSGDSTYALWVDSSGCAVYKLPVGQERLDAAAVRLRERFSRFNPRRPERTDVSWLAPLGEELLGPFAGRLDGYDHLVIAPCGGLHALPLHVLAPPGKEPLGVTHSISYTPSLSLYARLLARARLQRGGGAGTSAFATGAREDEPDIQEAFGELPSWFATATGGTLLTGKQASVTAFHDLAPGSSMVYLSCHGVFNPREPRFSELLLSSGGELPSRLASKERERGMTVNHVVRLSVPARLVVLDACVSGEQRLYPGDEPMGFPAAFLLAGVSCVIASNWNVEVASGRVFMGALLEEWAQPGRTLAESMRVAYAVTRNRYPHPFQWGAFSIHGYGQLQFKE
jgi:CHAT domain-containing protein